MASTDRVCLSAVKITGSSADYGITTKGIIMNTVVLHPASVSQAVVNARAVAKRPDLHTEQVLLDACDVLKAHGNDHMDFVLGDMLSRTITIKMSDRISAELSVVPPIPLFAPIIFFAAGCVVAGFLAVLL